MKAAARPQQGAEDQAVCLDQQNQESAHRLFIRFQSAAKSARSRALSAAAASRRAMITMSTAGRRSCCCRKLSRICRLMRFRQTAFLEALREIASPRRAWPYVLGAATAVKRGW